MLYFFGLLPLSCDTPNRLDRLEDKGVFGLTCLGFLVSLLLRFWPFAIVFASQLNGAGRQSLGRARAVRQCDSRSQCRLADVSGLQARCRRTLELACARPRADKAHSGARGIGSARLP